MIVKEQLGDILKPKSQDEIEDAIKNMSDKELVNLGIENKSSDILTFALDRDMTPKMNGEVLKWAAEAGDINLVKRTLREDIHPGKILAALVKIKDIRAQVFELIVADDRFDPSYLNDRLIRWSASNGHSELVNMLMQDNRVDPSAINNAALEGAIVYEHNDIVRMLLRDSRVREKLDDRMKSFEVVQKYINENQMGGLGNILKPKSQDEVKQAALEIKDPDELLRIAVTKIGDESIVEEAIKRGADPNKISSDVQKVKNPKIIEILLTNPQTKISANSLVYKAAKLGLEDQLINLVKKDKLNPGQKNSILLVWAVGFGREKLVEHLLKDKRVDPGTEKESIAEALSIAIARGNNNLVDILLKDDRIDPSADYNRPIKVAAQFGNLNAVKSLLADKRVDPSAADQSAEQENFAINTAAENDHLEVVEVLLKDDRVKKKLSLPEIKKFEDMVKKIVRESLIDEEVAMAEPRTKPTTKPDVKPGTKPGRPSPIRRDRPSVTPRPKATAEDVAKKFLKLIEK